LYNVLHEPSEIEGTLESEFAFPFSVSTSKGLISRGPDACQERDSHALHPVKDIIQMAEDRVRRSWVPIPHGPPVNRGLGLQVVSELRERIPFCIPVLSRYALVAAGEHNGLKNYAVDLIGVAESEAHDLSHAIIVETVDHGNLQGGLHSSRKRMFSSARSFTSM